MVLNLKTEPLFYFNPCSDSDVRSTKEKQSHTSEVQVFVLILVHDIDLPKFRKRDCEVHEKL